LVLVVYIQYFAAQGLRFKSSSILLDFENGGSTIVRNVGNYLPGDMA
jgi:hypothetical protein